MTIPGPHAAFVVIAVGDVDTTDDQFAQDVAGVVDFVRPFKAHVVDHPAAVDFLARHLIATTPAFGAGTSATALGAVPPDGDVPDLDASGERLRTRRRLRRVDVQDAVREAFMARRTIEPDGDDTVGTPDHNRKA